MVTAPHALAAQCGLSVLRDGGNAADACIAIAAALSVVYPHMTGLGGDVFFLYYSAAEGRVYCYNGSGASAHAATRRFYQERKLHAIPERGGAAALTVPGTIDAWFALHDRFGSVELSRVLAPAIAYANQGSPAARSLVGAVSRLRDVLESDEGAADLYLRNGPSRIGQRVCQPRLGATLAAIAKEGRAWFYEGEGASSIDAYCRRVGSPLRAADLASHRGFFCEPAARPFAGLTSLTAPPNSQGIALLVAQATYEAYAGDRDLDIDSPAGMHAAVESIRLAFADRDRYVCDPGLAPAWAQLLEGERARLQSRKIDPDSAIPLQTPAPDRGDTAYFACADREGNAVSFIQSLFHSFGSAVIVPELGVALNNRGTAFTLADGEIRSLAPGLRPFHTLMPCMLLRDGKPHLLYGSMGGEGQPQTALVLSTRIVRQGMDPQAAIEAPRWRWGKTWLDEPAALNVEARTSQACVAGLRARGHHLNVLGDWDESMGHAGAILIDDAGGLMTGGADPRSDGAALAL